jgi:hypothetical protein
MELREIDFHAPAGMAWVAVIIKEGKPELGSFGRITVCVPIPDTMTFGQLKEKAFAAARELLKGFTE